MVGILNPVQMISQMDSMAFVGLPVAEQYFGFDGHPTDLYVRAVPSQVSAVAAVLPAAKVSGRLRVHAEFRQCGLPWMAQARSATTRATSTRKSSTGPI